MRPNLNVEKITRDEINASIDAAVKNLREIIPVFKGKFIPGVSKNNFYSPSENTCWTNGFHTGMYWLAWEVTGDDIFKDAANIHVDSFLHRIENEIEVDNHDMGFLYSLSCVAAWQLVGNETGKRAAVMAADKLISRFHEKGGFIQAWGELGAPDNYRLIIDCLLNMPLLYWATQVTEDEKYACIAKIHTATSVANLVRDDFSTYHTFFFDPETGEPTKGVTAQGYKDSSPWARGQAWGIYGLALSYHYTKDPKCIDLFYKITDFFIDRSPSDGICYWDLCFSDGDGEPKDSSAAAIAACGMLEMAKYLPANEAERYTEVAKQIAGALARNYIPKPGESNGLLLHGVCVKSSLYNPWGDAGVDECNVWGDYYWMELLVRLSRDWDMYW